MGWTPEDMPDQRGRVAVVTGANGGLGFEVARALARRGARVIMAARDQDKAERAERVITDEHAGADLEVRELDLASLASVRACADGIVADHARIDLLVNNAGLMGIAEHATDDGFEMQLGVNHLGHFVLTRRLLPVLVAAPAARIVAVTSLGRLVGRRIDPGNPHLRGRYDPWRAYGQSKMANLQFAVELNRRLVRAGAPARCVTANPGVVRTDLQARGVRDTSGGLSQRFFHGLASVIGPPVDRGAWPVLRAATDPGARGGELYTPRLGETFGTPAPRRLFRSPPERVTRILWEVSERETSEPFDVAAIVARGR